MGVITATTRVHARNSIGQFIAACEAGGTATVKALVEEGEQLSAGFAPKDTGHLASSIHSRMTGATSGEWYVTAKHWGPMEFGATPHIIEGNPLAFWWENAGEFFVGPMVNHPGNAAQPFMRPAYEIVMPKSLQVADRFYPG